MFLIRARYVLPDLNRAKARIARQKTEVNLPLPRIVNVRKEVFGELKVRRFLALQSFLLNFQTFTNLGSQFGDDRPLSTIRFSPNSKLLLTTSWTGTSKIWDVPNLNLLSTKRGHTGMISGAAWHPLATIGASENSVNFATGGGEGSVKLWSLAE
jgi:U4/U6 small nuclear ribonucleoprotein PRP4